MSKCLRRDEIFEYAGKGIPENKKDNIEGHLFGDVISTSFDKDLNVEIKQYRYNGCTPCLKVLAEINESPDAMLSKHI